MFVLPRTTPFLQWRGKRTEPVRISMKVGILVRKTTSGMMGPRSAELKILVYLSIRICMAAHESTACCLSKKCRDVNRRRGPRHFTKPKHTMNGHCPALPRYGVVHVFSRNNNGDRIRGAPKLHWTIGGIQKRCWRRAVVPVAFLIRVCSAPAKHIARNLE